MLARNQFFPRSHSFFISSLLRGICIFLDICTVCSKLIIIFKINNYVQNKKLKYFLSLDIDYEIKSKTGFCNYWIQLAWLFQFYCIQSPVNRIQLKMALNTAYKKGDGTTSIMFKPWFITYWNWYTPCYILCNRIFCLYNLQKINLEESFMGNWWRWKFPASRVTVLKPRYCKKLFFESRNFQSAPVLSDRFFFLHTTF